MNATQAIDRLGQAIRRQHKAFSTEDSYVFWLRRYLKALATMDPQLSSEKKVESFLTQLARESLSASSQNQAFNALLYVYREVLEKPFGRINALRAKGPVHERRAPTVEETQALLQTVRNEGGYASHCLQRGTNPRAIQKSMGHKYLETTMGYFHAEALSVSSPLDALFIVPTALDGKSVHSVKQVEKCAIKYREDTHSHEHSINVSAISNNGTYPKDRGLYL